MFASWARQVPAEFVFAVRGPRQITHILRLQNPRVALANFMASGLLELGIHLGPILWQFPSNFRFDAGRFEAFLNMLPHDTDAAAALAREHDASVRVPDVLRPENRRVLRHAFEVRHDSFRCPDFIGLLRAYDAALVCSDSSRWPRWMDITSDFVYCRLHADRGRHPDGYDNAALDWWVSRIKDWARGAEPWDAERIGGKARPKRRDVFVFFDNDRKVRAPANAMELVRRLRA